MKLSLNIGKREFGFSIGQKSLNPVEDFLRGDHGESRSGADLSSPYSQSIWVYVAISILAENVAQIPFRFSRGQAGGDDLIESGPVVDLFNRPHPTLDRGLFWNLVVTWLMLRGEFFVMPQDGAGQPVALSPTRRSRIQQMITLPPEMFWHVVQGYDLAGWRFTGAPLLSPVASQMLLPEEVIHSRTPNPYLYWRGMSPLTVASVAMATDYAAAQFMRGLMVNNADTGVIVQTDQQLDEVQREQMLAALRDRKRKAGTADRPLLLWGGAQVVKPTVSSADMQFLAHREMNRREIGAIFRVPDFAMGFSQQRTLGTGAGAEQERYNFIESTITPLCRRLEAAFEPIVKSFGPDIFGWFDVESLPVMQEARRTRVDTATKMFNMGVPFNQLNSVYDLGFEDLPWGDKGYLPFSLQEVTPGPALPASPDPTALPADPNKNLLARALRLLTPPHVCAPNPEYEAALKGSINLKKSKLKRFFFEQRNRVLANLTNETRAATRAIDDLFNTDDENKDLLGKLRSLLIADLEYGGAQLFNEIGAIDFKLPPLAAIKFLNAREPAIKGINATTWDALKSSLSEGLSGGESFADLSDRVKAVYNVAEGRADMIALTETNTATNAGRYEGMTEAKVERKGWRTSHLENSRLTHIENEIKSQAEGGIPIDDLWPNGLLFPSDPEGDAGEVINCHCFGYAVAGKGFTNSACPTEFMSFIEYQARRAEPLQNAGAPLQNDLPAQSPVSPPPEIKTPPAPAPAPAPPQQIHINVSVQPGAPTKSSIAFVRDDQGHITGATKEETTA